MWRLDRLGRSLRHLLTVLAELSECGIAFRSLTEAIDTTTAAGRLQVHLFAALAEFERSLGQERTRAGLEAARARGRIGGRPAVVTPRKLAAALAMRAQGDMTMTQIAEELRVSAASLYRRLARHRQEADVIGSATASLAVEQASTTLLDLITERVRLAGFKANPIGRVLRYAGAVRG